MAYVGTVFPLIHPSTRIQYILVSWLRGGSKEKHTHTHTHTHHTPHHTTHTHVFIFLYPLFVDCIDGGKRKVQEVKVPSTSSKNPRSELAAEKRKKIMEQMAKQQKNFLKKHKNELENIVSSPTDDSPRYV